MDTKLKRLNEEISPVLFLIFNRPNHTKLVFQQIRKVKPSKLYIAADGPRHHIEGEAQLCEFSREIATAVDWDCKLITLFRSENLGCGKAVSEAITWFFEQETEGIILEDDCVPAKTFFRYCTELLHYYRHDTRVMQIGGSNLNRKWLSNTDYSYVFSNQSHIWGWATWKRAWEYYDFKMKEYEHISNKNYLSQYFNSIYEYEYKKWVFDKTFNQNMLSTWDYQWEFAMLIQSGLKIIPKKNMVLNIGFGNDATHTTGTNKLVLNQTIEKMDFPLTHPDFMMVDGRYDQAFLNSFFTTNNFKMKSNLKRIVNSVFPN